ncbi:hypothetical protein Bpfe_015743, partial [Biomphalaria pfeifferi]
MFETKQWRHLLTSRARTGPGDTDPSDTAASLGQHLLPFCSFCYPPLDERRRVRGALA